MITMKLMKSYFMLSTGTVTIVLAQLFLVGLAVKQSAGLTQSDIPEACPPNIPLYLTTDIRMYNHYCYQFVNEERYWADARYYCALNGGSLVAISDEATNDFIKTTLDSLSWTNNGVWIGLHDITNEGMFQWVAHANKQSRRLGWSNWASGHPGNWWANARDCVRMERDSDWRWKETPCDSKFYTYKFICQYASSLSTTSASPILEEMKSSLSHVSSTLTPGSLILSTISESADVDDVYDPDKEDTQNAAGGVIMPLQDEEALRENSTNTILMIGASVFGAVAFVLLVILIVVVRRRKSQKTSTHNIPKSMSVLGNPMYDLEAPGSPSNHYVSSKVSYQAIPGNDVHSLGSAKIYTGNSPANQKPVYEGSTNETPSPCINDGYEVPTDTLKKHKVALAMSRTPSPLTEENIYAEIPELHRSEQGPRRYVRSEKR